jgi:hypothetical protein
MRAVSMGMHSTVASVTTPVSPIPPAVAQNSSASEVGVTSTVPFGVCSVNERTWFVNVPSAWWFLPWMSAAIAPPTVT